MRPREAVCCGLGAAENHAVSRCWHLLAAAVHLPIEQAGRRSVGHWMLLLDLCTLLRTACSLLHELLAKQLLVPQVRLYWLHAALRLRFLQDCLRDVGLCGLLSGLGLPSGYLPRVPSMSLRGLSTMLILHSRSIGLGMRSGSLLLLPGRLRGAEAGHGAQSI